MERYSLLQAHRYRQALLSGKMSDILAELGKGADVNQKGLYSAMDVFISRGYYKGIAAILANPRFNPNTKSPDGFYLVEHAMLRSEPLALRIMAHPNFNINQRVSMGRTLAMSAVMFSMPNVFKAAKAYTRPTDKDERGQTLDSYLQQYGRPERARLIRIRRSMQKARQALLEQKLSERSYV